MDGYAFEYKQSDTNAGTPTTFDEVGVSLAGHPFQGHVAQDQCVRITTGAKLPEDCDTVVIQENTTLTNEESRRRIQVHHLPAKGENVREIGSNIAAGDVICQAGTRIKPALLGLLASTGTNQISCVSPIKVAIFSTGDELVSPGAQPSEGQIFDANGYLLESMLDSPNIEVTNLGIVADTPEAVRAAMKVGMQADLVMSSGGVSVGEADVVKQVLEELGELHMWKILMKPGKPLTFGQLDSGAYYFGLPGNPVSAMVTFAVFVVPALRKMLGVAAPEARVTTAISRDQLHKIPGRMEMQRGILAQESDGTRVVSTTGLQDSHILTSMAKANCFVRLPIESAGVEKGETVEVLPFEELLL